MSEGRGDVQELQELKEMEEDGSLGMREKQSSEVMQSGWERRWQWEEGI